MSNCSGFPQPTLDLFAERFSLGAPTGPRVAFKRQCAKDYMNSGESPTLFHRVKRLNVNLKNLTMRA